MCMWMCAVYYLPNIYKTIDFLLKKQFCYFVSIWLSLAIYLITVIFFWLDTKGEQQRETKNRESQQERSGKRNISMDKNVKRGVHIM